MSCTDDRFHIKGPTQTDIRFPKETVGIRSGEGICAHIAEGRTGQGAREQADLLEGGLWVLWPEGTGSI